MTDEQNYFDVEGKVHSVLEMDDAIAFYALGKLYVMRGVEGPFTLGPAQHRGYTRVGFADAPAGPETVIVTVVWRR